MKTIWQNYVLGWRLGRVAERNGRKLLTDRVHLNEKRGEALVDLAESQMLGKPGWLASQPG